MEKPGFIEDLQYIFAQQCQSQVQYKAVYNFFSFFSYSDILHLREQSHGGYALYNDLKFKYSKYIHKCVVLL